MEALFNYNSKWIWIDWFAIATWLDEKLVKKVESFGLEFRNEFDLTVTMGRGYNRMTFVCSAKFSNRLGDMKKFTIATLVATSIESTSLPNMNGKWYSGLMGSTSAFWFRAIFAKFSGERSSKFFIGWIAILSNT